MTTKKTEGREMTPGEIAANEAHIAAHKRAVDEEAERNEIIKQRIAAGDINPAVTPDQLQVTPQENPPRQADSVRTSAEQYGGARGPAANEAPAAPAADKKRH